jgi:hypothetical protein
MYSLVCNKNEKQKSTTSEQFQNHIEISQKEAKSIALTHKYMTASFAGLVQVHKSGGVKIVSRPNLPLPVQ